MPSLAIVTERKDGGVTGVRSRNSQRQNQQALCGPPDSLIKIFAGENAGGVTGVRSRNSQRQNQQAPCGQLIFLRVFPANAVCLQSPFGISGRLTRPPVDSFVELVGVEPTSRQGSETLSTCLVPIYFRHTGCPAPATCTLSSCVVGNAIGTLTRPTHRTMLRIGKRVSKSPREQSAG